ncbi:MAG: adenosine deaminase, partial [Acidimicrobiia bacterium]|nr:adenosine deaminase [Acidimicrobiia bacterium]
LLADMSIVDGEIVSMGRLASHVLDHRIPLEMAPTCHVQIGAVPDLAHHPIAAMLRAGFNVSVNTDNRLMSGVSVSSEMAAVRETFDLTADEVGQLVLNGIEAGFAPLAVRRQLIAGLG